MMIAVGAAVVLLRAPLCVWCVRPLSLTHGGPCATMAMKPAALLLAECLILGPCVCPHAAAAA